MKIIFMGTPQFAVVCLNSLLDSKHQILTVVTAPDKPVGRGLKVRPSPVKETALSANLPILQPEKLKDPLFLSEIKRLNADLIVVVAFRILPEELFTMAIYGAINLHGSLLPKYRGAAPINWAIINGDKETGVTTFFLKKAVDTGNMIAQEKIPIGENMTAGELHDVMAETGANLIRRTIEMIEQGGVKSQTQDESAVSKAPKIFPQDCLIDFNQPVEKVHNFIRGLSPRPGAYTYLKGKRLVLLRSQVGEITKVSGKPGTILDSPESKSLVIQCQSSQLLVLEIKLEGKRAMRVEDFLRGYRIDKGVVLGEGE